MSIDKIYIIIGLCFSAFALFSVCVMFVKYTLLYVNGEHITAENCSFAGLELADGDDALNDSWLLVIFMNGLLYLIGCAFVVPFWPVALIVKFGLVIHRKRELSLRRKRN